MRHIRRMLNSMGLYRRKHKISAREVIAAISVSHPSSLHIYKSGSSFGYRALNGYEIWFKLQLIARFFNSWSVYSVCRYYNTVTVKLCLSQIFRVVTRLTKKNVRSNLFLPSLSSEWVNRVCELHWVPASDASEAKKWSSPCCRQVRVNSSS